MDVAAKEQTDKFALVQILADDLSRGGIEIPSFPDIVVRIRKALADENVTVDKIVQIVGADPVLAARILTIANSAVMRGAGDPITDLRTAVNRIGHAMVRNTAVSHGIAQSKKAIKLEQARVCLDNLWDECAYVAAVCYVLTRQRTKLNPDEAMLIGLMHGIGKLYILGRAESHPDLFDEQNALEHIMDEWHAQIGSSIVDTWGFESHVAHAIGNYADLERDHDGDVDYTDVLSLAQLIAQFVRAENMEVQLDSVPAARRLNLSTADMMPILNESRDQIRDLRNALGK